MNSNAVSTAESGPFDACHEQSELKRLPRHGMPACLPIGSFRRECNLLGFVYLHADERLLEAAYHLVLAEHDLKWLVVPRWGV